MPLFSRSFLDSVRANHDPSQWPGVLADPDRQDVRERLEAVVGAQAPRVRKGLERLLTSSAVRDLHLGRALTWGLHLASQIGATADGISKGGVARMVVEGRPGFYLAPLLFHTGGLEAGLPEDVDRLVRSLEAVFGERAFALHVRRPLAKDADPSPVARAVQLWLRSVDRGEWQGRHAVYEDETVSIELTLLDRSLSDGRSALALFVGPSAAMERLAAVDAHLQALVRQYETQDTSLPLVGLLVANPRWELTRGFASQLLYGTPDAAVTDSGGESTTHVAAYRTERFSLFADPVFARLSALWWMEGSRSDPLRYRAWAHDNPWCAHDVPPPPFPGLHYRAATDAERGTLGSDGHVMAWSGQGRDTWRIEP